MRADTNNCVVRVCLDDFRIMTFFHDRTGSVRKNVECSRAAYRCACPAAELTLPNDRILCGAHLKINMLASSLPFLCHESKPPDVPVIQVLCKKPHAEYRICFSKNSEIVVSMSMNCIHCDVVRMSCLHMTVTRPNERVQLVVVRVRLRMPFVQADVHRATVNAIRWRPPW